MCDHARFDVLQMRERLQAAIAAGDVVVHSVEIDIARRRDQRVGAAIVVGLHPIVKSLNCAHGGSRALLLLCRRSADCDQRTGDNDHYNGKQASHYCASLSTTGSAAAVAGKSMVSATRFRSGKRISKPRANTTVAIGSVPHIRLWNSVGTAPAGGVILCAGGTSSFVHSVTLPLSYTSASRHPAKASNGS